MRVRLPVLIIPVVVLVLGGILSFSGSLRIGNFVLRNPIDLLQEAAERVGAFFRTPAATSPAIPASETSSVQPEEDRGIPSTTAVAAPRVATRVEALSQDSNRRPRGDIVPSSSAQLSDQLRSQNSSGSSQIPGPSTVAQPRLGSEPADALLANLALGGGTPSISGEQPAGNVQAPGGITLPGTLPPSDGDVPPGGILPPGFLPEGALPPGTILGPGGIGQLPGGVQPPGGILPGGINPGGINLGGINPGGVNPGGINPGGINPGGINPGGINPGGINPGDIVPGGVLPK